MPSQTFNPPLHAHATPNAHDHGQGLNVRGAHQEGMQLMSSASSLLDVLHSLDGHLHALRIVPLGGFQPTALAYPPPMQTTPSPTVFGSGWSLLCRGCRKTLSFCKFTKGGEQRQSLTHDLHATSPEVSLGLDLHDLGLAGLPSLGHGFRNPVGLVVAKPMLVPTFIGGCAFVDMGLDFSDVPEVLPINFGPHSCLHSGVVGGPLLASGNMFDNRGTVSHNADMFSGNHVGHEDGPNFSNSC